MSSHVSSAAVQLAIPPAAAMIQSMRGVGYTLQTAIADLIDNSITAQASNIWLEFDWNGEHSTIRMLDDGVGMDEQTLFQAMRPGSKNPLDQRAPEDLGRFGLGLKTASFAICRLLTVASKRREGRVHVRCWDLDHVTRTDRWELLTHARPESEPLLDPLDALPQGTLVVWEILDGLIPPGILASNKKMHDHFLETIERVREHLALVFHEFLEDGRRGIRIFINGEDEMHRIRAWDPYLCSEAATQQLPEERIYVNGGEVLFQGFVLPHPDRFKDRTLLERGGGPDGWSGQQGFYVYRNRRLLAWGTWLNLGRPQRWRREELYKLARIRLTIPNTLDQDWKIDIKKSTASPPPELRARLTELACDVRDRAVKVFRARGELQGPRQSPQSVVRVWSSIPRGESTRYCIDRKHPLVAQQLRAAAEHNLILEPLLQLIEQSVPLQAIWIDQSQKGEESQRVSPAPPPETLELAVGFLNHYMRVLGDDLETARQRLAKLEPFCNWSVHILKLNP